jgi:glycosyltransferase involved in cell wall biosynthesis
MSAGRPDAGPPRVSVILAFLDEELFLARAIETVIAQSEQRWELLLIDDGSSDRSAAIAEQFANDDPERVRVLRHPGGVNHGLPESRNLGLRHARGEWIAMIDADDSWDVDKLERQLDDVHGRTDVAMLCGPTWYHYIDESRPDELVAVTPDAPCEFPAGRFARALTTGRLESSPPPTTVLLHAATLRRVGGVPLGDNLYEDHRTFVAVGLVGAVLVSDVPLARYVIRPDSLNGSLATDGMTQVRQRRTFELWVLRYTSRQGIRGLQVAGAVISFRLHAALRRRWTLLRSRFDGAARNS